MREARHQSKTTRCAVYTRKSSEEGLEQSFNSLHAQQPPSLTLERLVEIAAATSDWNEQRTSVLAA